MLQVFEMIGKVCRVNFGSKSCSEKEEGKVLQVLETEFRGHVPIPVWRPILRLGLETRSRNVRPGFETGNHDRVSKPDFKAAFR